MKETWSNRIRNILKEIHFFEEFTNEELDFFSKQLSLRSVPKNTTLFQEGEVGDYLFFIVEGSVEIRLGSASAKNIIATLGYGQCVGQMALIDDYPRSATVTAMEPSELLLITKNKMDNMIKEYPALGIKIFKGLAKNLSIRLRAATGRFADLT